MSAVQELVVEDGVIAMATAEGHARGARQKAPRPENGAGAFGS